MAFGGTSSGTSSTSSPWSAALGNIGQSAWGMAKPLLNNLGSDFLEALRTGGVNSFLPWITRALDASRASSSGGIQDLRQNLARTGQGGSSFGQEQIQTAETQSGEQANMIPSSMIMDFIKQAPGFATGLANTAVGAESAAGNLNQTTTTTSTPSFWDMFIAASSGAQHAAASAFGGGGGAP
jgi:hypothetical protein